MSARHDDPGDGPHYLLNARQFREMMDLADAANLLSIGLPESHTTTPKGKLATLAEKVGTTAIFAEALEPRPCDGCTRPHRLLTRCPECDVHLCDGCHSTHRCGRSH